MTTTVNRIVNDSREADALVAFGLQPKLRPLAQPLYRELLGKFRLDAAFREVTVAFAEGLGLRVIEAHPQEGLVLHGESELFWYRLVDHPSMGVNDRLVLGMAHLAIATLAYPTAADLEEDSVRRVSIAGVDAYARRLMRRLREACHDGGLPRADAPFDLAWQAYERLSPDRPTPTRQLSRLSSQGVIKSALDWLVHKGMAMPAPELGVGHYRLRHRYRLQVREIASTEAFALLCDIRREQLAEED